MPFNTLPIATGFDQHYTCVNESCTQYTTTELNREHHLDDRTWTCNACGEPVMVTMVDDTGKTYRIVRSQAQHLKRGDLIYQEHDLQGGVLQVLGSSQAYGKGKHWYLGLQGFGGLTVEPDRYFNRIP